MHYLIHIFGWPHEALHVLALWLIGRRALSVTQTHVDIPDDLSTIEYVFVAGLPALVFFGGFALCANGVFTAPNLLQSLLWLLLSGIFGLAVFGTLGDVMLILQRLLEQKPPPPEE